MEVELAELKSKILKLLKEDIEFRYAVAGLIGLEEILRRLDRHEEELAKLREDLNRLIEDHNKLREDFNKAFQAFSKALQALEARLEAVEKRLEGVEKRLDKVEERLDKVEERLSKVEERLDKVEARLDKVEERLDKVEVRLGRVERTLEKITLDIEEEARSIIRYRLKSELGLDVKLEPLMLPELELNLYGVAGDVCVVGEATVRGGVRVLEDLLAKLEILKSKYPDKLRPKVIPVIYVSLAVPELVEEAKRREVWLLKATEDYYKPDLSSLLRG